VTCARTRSRAGGPAVPPYFWSRAGISRRGAHGHAAQPARMDDLGLDGACSISATCTRQGLSFYLRFFEQYRPVHHIIDPAGDCCSCADASSPSPTEGPAVVWNVSLRDGDRELAEGKFAVYGPWEGPGGRIRQRCIRGRRLIPSIGVTVPSRDPAQSRRSHRPEPRAAPPCRPESGIREMERKLDLGWRPAGGFRRGGAPARDRGGDPRREAGGNRVSGGRTDRAPKRPAQGRRPRKG